MSAMMQRLRQAQAQLQAMDAVWDIVMKVQNAAGPEVGYCCGTRHLVLPVEPTTDAVPKAAPPPQGQKEASAPPLQLQDSSGSPEPPSCGT